MTPSGSVVLVGPMGAGKSTIGRALAEELGVPFHDTDTLIEQRSGASIAWIFDVEGEAGFRERETAVIRDLAAGRGAVVATGGGAVLREENRRALTDHTEVVYLRATPDELFRRLRRDTQRPLLQVRDPLRRLRELYRERDPLYRLTARYVIETGRPTVPMQVNMILMQLELAGVIDAMLVPATVGREPVASR
jgi:shikimate kinase